LLHGRHGQGARRLRPRPRLRRAEPDRARMTRTVRAVARALGRRPIGPHPQEVAAALERLGPFEMPGEDESSPGFVLGRRGRTGSPLLRRVWMTGRGLLLWGEPLGRLGLLTGLSEAVCGLQPGWPPREHWIERRPPGDLTTSWIANLFPPADDFRAALRAL